MLKLADLFKIFLYVKIFECFYFFDIGLTKKVSDINMHTILNCLRQAVIEFDFVAIPNIMAQAINTIPNTQEILQDGLVSAMSTVGEKFETQEYFLPELMASAQAMNQALEILKPHLQKQQTSKPQTKFLLGTVYGDLHDIGKNIVKVVLTGINIEVIDLGKNVPCAEFISAVQKYRPHLLGMSALLTTTMMQMSIVINELERYGLRQDIKILVGGAAVTKEFAQEIGADCYCANAFEAVSFIKNFDSNKT